MFKYFLYTFFAWNLWESHAQEEDKPKSRSHVAVPQMPLLDQIGAHQQQWFRYNSLKETEAQEKLERLERGIEGQLQAVQIKMGIELKALRNVMEQQSQDSPDKREALRLMNQGIWTRIGSRFFYIERHETLNYHGASDRCRQLGGFLATIQDEHEYNELFSKVNNWNYWIDINNLGMVNQFTSSFTGSAPPYTRFASGTTKNRCVAVSGRNKYMYRQDCFSRLRFVCQSERW
ncbi:accessory gland protein Acp29AB [Drosophila takahashii]|uniref:accessory gland protein Acp29AB n=1 Tax=Drosophila takahashii TaxID=29030 RepID=UPI0038996926